MTHTFLDELQAILPEGCQPIILSDAIFKTPWFQTIEAKGWYWVGRVRGNVQISLDGEIFEGCTTIMKQATTTPTGLGTIFYSKSTAFSCEGTLFHGTEKGKHKKKKRGGISKDTKSLYYSKKAKQPWLLVSHLPNMCHHNVTELHEFDNNYIRVRGWLYFKDFNKFVSHSVVKTPEGKLVDITPRSSCIFQDHPFLEGNLTEEEYINLVEIQGYSEINL